VNTTRTHIYVRALNSRACTGFVEVNGRRFPCLLGRNGRTFRKKEGDGKSPKGSWKLEKLLVRSDKGHRFSVSLNVEELRPDDGWCDAAGDRSYNRKVRLPYPASHENLWRKDEAYDLLVTTSHNQRPRIQGLGSAIFLHLIRKDAQYTEGCVALSQKDMKHVLRAIKKNAYLFI